MRQVLFLIALASIACCILTLDAQVQFDEFRYTPGAVNAMLEDGNNLYLATSMGLMVIDRTDESLENFFFANSRLDAIFVTCLARRANGTIFVGTNNGLFRIDNGAISAFRPDELDDEILSLYADQEQNVWVGKRNWEFYRIDQNDTLTEISGIDNAPKDICRDNSGVLWLGMYDGLVRWDPVSGEITELNSGNSILPDDHILDIAKDSQGNVWVMCWMGMTKIAPSGEWTLYPDPYGETFFGCEDMDIDTQGRIWIVKPNCLYRWTPTEQITYNATHLGLGNSRLTSVYCGSSVFMGAHGKVIENPDSPSQYSVVDLDLQPRPIISIATDGASRTWISYNYGSSPPTTCYYSIIDNGVISHYQLPPDVSYVRFISTDERYMYACSQYKAYMITTSGWTMLRDFYMNHVKGAYSGGKAFFSSGYDGIYVHDGQSGYNIDLPAEYSQWNGGYLLTPDANGKLWFVNEGNLFTYSDSTFTEHPAVSVTGAKNCLTPLSDGTLLIGDSNGVIWSYNGDVCTQFSTVPGYHNSILNMLSDNNGFLLISTDSNVFLRDMDNNYINVLPILCDRTGVISIRILEPSRFTIDTSIGVLSYTYSYGSGIIDNGLSEVPYPSIYPNPSSGTVHICFPEGKHPDVIRVYNIRGQLVRELDIAEAVPISWDCKDYCGDAVANGIYFVKVQLDGRAITRKLLLRR